MSSGPTAASRPSVPVLDAQAAELKAERLWGMADAQKPELSVPSERLDLGEVRCCCSDSASVSRYLMRRHVLLGDRYMWDLETLPRVYL